MKGLPFRAGVAAALFVPRVCEAHVKWFCAYDTTAPPLPLSDVVTPVFLLVAGGFGVAMFVAYALDGVVERRGWLARLDAALARRGEVVEVLVRAATGGFFVSLWTAGGTILTPELKTAQGWVPWVQFAIAVAVLFRPTLVAAAAGIVFLYGYAAAVHGAFHMMDYPIFLGLAAYLGLSASRDPRLLALRLPALYFNLAFTMMWGAIEKFGYPCWTAPLFAAHPDVTLGLRFDWFMDIAGFVEFSLAFFMVTGTALLRFSCVVLLLLLASAVPEFGKVDAVGHSVIIAGLLAMIIAGPAGIRPLAPVRGDNVLARCGAMTLLYGGAAVVLFGLYYGAQFVAGR